MVFSSLEADFKINKKNKFLSINNIEAVLVLLIIFLILISTRVNAFSSYERETAARLYEDLDKEYEIREFRKDEAAYKILRRLENNIIEKEFKDEDFTIHYIDHETINAYYIGAGNIMIFDGLLKELDTTEELAGLIAHEMGHGIKKHLYKNLQRNLGLSVINILFNTITDQQYQTMTNIFQNLISRGYSREQEEEADIYAVDLMMRADYAPQGLVDLMILFKEKSMNVKVLEFTQTHPIPDSRIEYLNEYIAQKKEQQNEEIKDNETKNSDQIKNEVEQDLSSKSNLKDSKKFELKKELNNDIIRLNYPEEWELKEENIRDNRTVFKYSFSSENTSGEFTLHDLSDKNFMETARKHYNYALLTAEEEGKTPNKSIRKINDISIYRLQWSEADQIFYEYYLESENSKKMLKIFFISDEGSQEIKEDTFERLINTVEFN
ncbi:MAG: M48 family metallopeptidase [Halanaerobium sp.]